MLINYSVLSLHKRVTARLVVGRDRLNRLKGACGYYFKLYFHIEIKYLKCYTLTWVFSDI